jgi:NADH:ubiquinone oxidoreductase subunit 6 (subunit J)
MVNGALVAAALFVGVAGFLIGQPAIRLARPPLPEDPTAAIGTALVGPFALPFLLLAVLLVVGLIGALYFAREDD